MNLSLDKVPSNLEEAVSLLKDALDENEKAVVKNIIVTKLHVLHVSVGQCIRNEWSLWERKNVLPQWFKKQYGVDHADDVSAIIIECVVADLLGRPRKDKELAKEFIEHWNTHKKKINKKDNE